MNENEVKVGSIATVKVGRNLVEVEILGAEGEKWKVKSISSGREFLTAKLESIKITGPIPTNTENTMNEEQHPAAKNESPAAEPEIPAVEPTPPENETSISELPGAENDCEQMDAGAPAESPKTEDAPNPAPESGTDKTEKKLGLYGAAVEVLRRSNTPLKCKAIIAKAVERGLWTPTGGKTPEQSLYSSIFREIKTKETPRIIKSETVRGAFEFNRS